MGSQKLVFTVIAASLLCLSTLTCPVSSHSSVGDDGESALSSSGSGKVDLFVYYETLCPYCANFMANSLGKVFEKGLISIVNLRLIPWGNAFLNSDNSFLCQHGPDECMLNTVEACTIAVYPQPEKHFSFIHCVESLVLEGKHAQWASCFNKAGLTEDLPVGCYKNGYGKELELRCANETAHLEPPHTFVPWVVVNNQPLEADYQNFVTHVCNAYKGAAKPEACKSPPSTMRPSEDKPGCYSSEAKNLTWVIPEKLH